MDGASEVSSRSIYASNADAAPMISGNDDTARGISPPGLLRLDAGELDHLAPLLGFVGD
jgi:hypothetical protein